MELAVAATKTYSATLLIDSVRGGHGEAVQDLATLASETLSSMESSVEEAVAMYRYVERMVTTGRGYSSATAAEGA